MTPLREIEVDEDHSLFVAPHVAEFSSLKGGASRHLMANETDQRLAVKIKCSNNSLYRVSPVYTCLEPGSAQRLQVVRDPGKPGTDKLIILYKHSNSKNAYEAFHEEKVGEVQKQLIVLIAREPPKLASIDEFTIDESALAAPQKPRKPPKPERPTKTPQQQQQPFASGIRLPMSMQKVEEMAKSRARSSSRSGAVDRRRSNAHRPSRH